MNGVVIWIIQFLLTVNLSIGEFFVKTPASVSQRKILLIFKTPLITECLLKCKNTAGCKDVATVEDQNKKSFECYLIASYEINHEVEEKFLEVNKLSSIAVSLFTLYVFILPEFVIKRRPHVFKKYKKEQISRLVSVIS